VDAVTDCSSAGRTAGAFRPSAPNDHQFIAEAPTASDAEQLIEACRTLLR
jgi:hypothetical protein